MVRRLLDSGSDKAMKRRQFIELIGCIERDGLVIAPRLQQKEAGKAIHDEPVTGSRVVIQAAGPSGCGYDRQI